jgi:hypothetical protein
MELYALPSVDLLVVPRAEFNRNLIAMIRSDPTMRLPALPHLCKMVIGLGRCAGRDVTDNNISQLPPGPCSLPKLWKLFVGNNKLASVPDWVGNSSDLEMLDVSHNLLKLLPESCDYRSLKSCMLSIIGSEPCPNLLPFRGPTS